MGSWSMLLLALLNGGGNDLLDYLSVKAYWQAKSVAITTEGMVTELKAAEKAEGAQPLGGPKARAVRRLMATRALGELKDPNALGALKKMVDSKELFESEYAQRAIAAIEGKTFKDSAPTAKEMQSDVWLLPSTCGAVVQASTRAGKPATAEEIVKAISPSLPEGTGEKALTGITQDLISLAEQIGNIRLHGVTVGIAGNVGSRSGHVVVVPRGLYDPDAVKAALVRAGAKSVMFGQTEVLSPNEDMAIILASKERLVLLGGPTRAELPIGDMVNAVNTGKGKLEENEALAKLIKSIDTTGPVWAVMQVTESYREASFLAPFDTVTLQSKQKEGQIDISLAAQGKDVEKVSRAVVEFNNLMAKGSEEVSREAQRMPPLKLLADLLASIKAQADGTKATATAQLKGDLKGLLAIPFMRIVGRPAVRDQSGVRPVPPPHPPERE